MSEREHQLELENAALRRAVDINTRVIARTMAYLDDCEARGNPDRAAHQFVMTSVDAVRALLGEASL